MSIMKIYKENMINKIKNLFNKKCNMKCYWINKSKSLTMKLIISFTNKFLKF